MGESLSIYLVKRAIQIRYLTCLNLKSILDAARAIPYQRVDSDQFSGIELWVRRDDLLDPLISGNKAYKLLYNLTEASERGFEVLITCGGAWSNHLHATAAAGARFGFRTVGVVRGQRPPVMSGMLQDAERLGMRLIFISRQEYRLRHHPDFLGLIGLEPNCGLYIPEGGANFAGARGVSLLGQIIEETAPIKFDQLWVACGTGLTLGGLSSSIDSFPVHGVEVLKAGDGIRREVRHWRAVLSGGNASDNSCITMNNIHLTNQYHCGGYGKYPGRLLDFHQSFERQSGIPLDPIYTAKLLYALSQEVRAGRICSGFKVLALHSGGLQGRRGFHCAD
ncbi:1-aminocyclopropane-1-carboxylate deaminase/D-cysteine desulfhydrase [Microbulbifer sp. EKSA008]|uniref:1-aminocyclopropane-1-carboxylate deaminase/D-cysteine desulfhydrase n=1 Tax=unclassified Microbulbifer TaxID=2619833 RepID=UPI0040394653